MNEIVRKFLPKEMPDISSLKAVKHERYYLYLGNGIELRVQKIGNNFELQRKYAISELSKGQETWSISKNEYETLIKMGNKKIERDYYLLSDKPELSLLIYHGIYEGLVRIEVDFESEEEAKAFTPLSWFGKEITHEEIGRDGRLIGLNREDFLKKLAEV